MVLLFEEAPDAPLPGDVCDALARFGRVQIPNCLGEQTALRLLESLRRSPWSVVFRGAAGTYDVSPNAAGALDIDKRAQLVELIHNQASTELQYIFDSYRISDEFEANRLTDGVLAEFFAGLNSEPCLQRLRALTGEPRIAYVDAQATRYGPGHFLTEHDDFQAGKDRLFAYVLNLTPVWRADWGGALLFIDDDNGISAALAPRWNALNVFRVPQRHAVSFVAPFAGAWRYSITGWIRATRPSP